jgi:hypothetical protein
LWDETKGSIPQNQREDHPARYTMVEAVNLYDDGIIFEPIHRLLCGIDVSEFLNFIVDALGADFAAVESRETLESTVEKDEGFVGFVSNTNQGILRLKNHDTLFEAVQNVLDTYLEQKSGRIDYVHDLSTVFDVSSTDGNAGLVMPKIEKHDFFPYIIENGCYPRKSFSLGESHEKRYYMEARAIGR